MQTIKAKLDKAATAQRNGHSNEALMLAAEALVLARRGLDPLHIAYTLRHVADISSQNGLFDQAASEIAEAIQIYRERVGDSALDLANALRISALNAERGAQAAWQEAQSIYASVGVAAGVVGAQHHLEHLSAAMGGPS